MSSMPEKSHPLSNRRFQLLRVAGLFKALLKNRMAALGLMMLIISGIVAVTAPLIAPYPAIQTVAGPQAQPEWVMNFPDGYYLSRNLQAISDPAFSTPTPLQELRMDGSSTALSSVLFSYAHGLGNGAYKSSVQLAHPAQSVDTIAVSRTFHYPYHGPPSNFLATILFMAQGASPSQPIHMRVFVTQVGGLNFDLWSGDITRSGQWAAPSYQLLSSTDQVLTITGTRTAAFSLAAIVFSAAQDYTYGVEVTFHGAQQVNITNFQLSLAGTAWGLLGTDGDGNDLLSRDIIGTTSSIIVGLTAAALGIGLGLIIGLIAGLVGGLLDEFLMRLTDVFLTIPFLPLAIILVVILTPSELTIVMIIAFFSWMGFARVIRSQVLSLRERPFIEAARAAGSGNGRILSKHLFPNLVGLTYVNLALSVPGAIITYAALSFLGLGDPTVISWGSILSENFALSAETSWWWVIPPGLAIAFVSLSFVLLGYALDEMFNPKLRKRR